MMWVIIGVVLGVALAYVFSSVRSGKLSVRWYQWVLAAIAIGLLLLAIQNYFALQDELEPKLANFSAIAFGLPGILAAALIWVIPGAGKFVGKRAA